MENEEQLSPIGESSVPVPSRMLRRLKRATSISDLCPGSEYLGSAKDFFDGFEKEDETRSDLEGLGVEDGVTARKVIDFDSVTEFNPSIEDLGEKGDEGSSDSEIRVSVTKEAEKELSDSVVEELGDKGDEERSDSEIRVSVIEDLGEKGDEEMSDFDSGFEGLGEKGEDETGEEMKVWETRKKRSVLESGDKERKEKKKRSKKNVDFDELPISSRNMSKKERREHLDQLRAENQRLLRETRDAAFEPVPLVRKPISSVLEKIRRRKEEISKQFLSRKKSKHMDICDNEDENELEEVVAEEKNEDTDLKTRSKQNPARYDSLEEDSAGPSEKPDIPCNKRTETNPTHQDPSLPSPTTNSGDELLEKKSSRSLEEVMIPSILTMNLKLNSSPVPDKASEEAEHSKENSDFETQDSSPGDPVRKFIDEDAEEEDDSDNDLLRFEDEDEDEDGNEEDDDDLRDMIVSQFKEDPKDKDRRNELHQKWLEQEDAAGTEKLLQKLKRGLQQDKTSLFEDEEDDADGEEGAEDADDEEATKPGANEDENEDEEEEEDPSNALSMRMKIKKIKEMIPLMFTEEDDAYVSSDDEEMEKKLLQQRLYKKMEQKTKSSSSVTGDENSEEVLRYIKKPEILKKAKPSFKEKALMGINKNPAASKSSFLGRITKNSTSQGSRKRGSNIVRGYIFERDDSNRKTSNSAPEEPLVPETNIKEKSNRTRQAPAKFTASQTQERSATKQAKAVEEETSSRQQTTLLEILKMSSKKTSSNEIVISESIFAAFKLDKKAVKTNP